MWSLYYLCFKSLVSLHNLIFKSWPCLTGSSQSSRKGTSWHSPAGPTLPGAQGQGNELSSQASGARGQQGVPPHLRAPWGPPLPVRSSSCGPPAHLPVAHLPGLAVPHTSVGTRLPEGCRTYLISGRGRSKRGGLWPRLGRMGVVTAWCRDSRFLPHQLPPPLGFQ